VGQFSSVWSSFGRTVPNGAGHCSQDSSMADRNLEISTLAGSEVGAYR
jgi:hypothetical protein